MSQSLPRRVTVQRQLCIMVYLMGGAFVVEVGEPSMQRSVMLYVPNFAALTSETDGYAAAIGEGPQGLVSERGQPESQDMGASHRKASSIEFAVQLRFGCTRQLLL